MARPFCRFGRHAPTGVRYAVGGPAPVIRTPPPPPTTTFARNSPGARRPPPAALPSADRSAVPMLRPPPSPPLPDRSIERGGDVVGGVGTIGIFDVEHGLCDSVSLPSLPPRPPKKKNKINKKIVIENRLSYACTPYNTRYMDFRSSKMYRCQHMRVRETPTLGRLFQRGFIKRFTTLLGHNWDENWTLISDNIR